MPGYSKTPLNRKLGLKDGLRCKFIAPPDAYLQWIAPVPDIKIARRKPYDFVHLFTNTTEVLERELIKLRTQIKPNGMVWVSWYKKSSGLSSEITEDVIRGTALPLGFVDVKVCAVTNDWSGLKLVIRKELRES